MRKAKKVIAALVLAFMMMLSPILPFMQPMVVMAAEAEDVHAYWIAQDFVPIRVVFESENIPVTWDDAGQNIHIAFYDGIVIVLYPGSNVAYVNDMAVEFYYAIVLEQGMSFIYFYDLLSLMDAVLIVYFEMASENLLTIQLTEEARDIVLYDFDFIVNAILENTPWESVISRSVGFDFMDYIAYLRGLIEDMEPLIFPLSLEEYEEFFGLPIYEYWFPIRDSGDPRYIAATYLSYLLWYGVDAFYGIGHLGPRELSIYRIQYRSLRMLYHRGGINRETDPSNTMRLDTFTHPDVRWFYGEVEVDLYAEMHSVFPEVPGNIVTEIITPGEIAYLRINSFATSAEFDDLVIAPFFDEIRDFDHLIIDIRGNGGGFVNNFLHNIMGRLIHEPIVYYNHQFFSGGELAVAAMNALVQSTSYILDSIENNDIHQWYTIEIMPAREFIATRDLTDFNQRDLASLQYVLVERDWIFPTGDGRTFDGEVWLLVDRFTASASSTATLLLMNTGIATVVGDNTSGVMGTHHIYLILPNTGMLFRMDIGYMTDPWGNSLEAYGIAPHVRNFAGMDALQTALELIADPYAYDRPDTGNVWDLNWLDIIGDNDIDFTEHPLTGNWAWDFDDSFIYELRPDGTGTRGFYGTRYEFYWYAYDNNLFIDVGFMIEHWAFTIVDGVLTIVSAQVPWITWSYIRQ